MTMAGARRRWLIRQRPCCNLKRAPILGPASSARDSGGDAPPTAVLFSEPFAAPKPLRTSRSRLRAGSV
jgi:hypothetical protein